MLFTGISLYRGDPDCGIIEKNVKKGIGMHLFLTGDIRIGKSTLIGKLLEQVDGSVKGFKTVPFRGKKRVSLIFIFCRRKEALRTAGRETGLYTGIISDKRGLQYFRRRLTDTDVLY